MKKILVAFLLVACYALCNATTTLVTTDLRNVRELYFYNGRMTTGNRPQYVCRNMNAENYCSQYRANTIRCINVEYRNGVRWQCANYQDNTANHLSIVNERVVCDRPSYNVDHIVDGSCHLEYSYRRN